MLIGLIAFGGVARSACADVRQLFICFFDAGEHEHNNRVFRIPLEGPDAYTLIEFAGPGDGLSVPAAMAVHPVNGRLYVGNIDSSQLLEFEINSDGTKGASRVYGTLVYYQNGAPQYPNFFSMAVRPSTGRIYVGCFYHSQRGIFEMREGSAGAVKVIADRPYPEPSYFYDECWICFDPEDDRIVYAGTGFENHIRKFDVEDGSDLGYLQGYSDVAYTRGPPEVSGHFLPHQFFVPRAGGGHDLLACTYIAPGSGPRRLVKLDPYADTFLGELPAGGPSLTLPMTIFDFVRDRVTGTLYAGGYYASLWEIAGDYQAIEKLSARYDIPSVGQSRVALSYGHSAGADTDRDGLTDDEEAAHGTDPYEVDSDDDGLPDRDEVHHDGSAAYDPYDPITNSGGTDTDALRSDTDGDGFSDAIEVAAGSDPLASGWTTVSFSARVNFAAPAASREPGFAVDRGRPYADGRAYGWR